MQVSKISASENTNNKNSEPAKKSIKYGLSAAVPGALGVLHGIYKKIEWDEFTFEIRNPDIIKNPNLVKLKLAMLKDPNNYDALSIFGSKENSGTKNLHLATKTIIDNTTNVEKLSLQHNPLGFFINYLMKLGFNPSKNKLMEFVTNYGIDKLNQDLKDISGINFDIELLKNKGRGKRQYRTVAIAEVKNGKINIKNKTQTEKCHAFKKILNPYDEKFFKFIDKLPFGKKFTNYMRATNSPIKSIKFKPLSHLYYDKTSMLKGAGFMAVCGTALYAGVDYCLKKHKTNIEKVQ